MMGQTKNARRRTEPAGLAKSHSSEAKPLFDQPANEAQIRYNILMHLAKGATELAKARDLAQEKVPNTLLVAATAILSKTADDLIEDIMEGKR